MDGYSTVCELSTWGMMEPGWDHQEKRLQLPRATVVGWPEMQGESWNQSCRRGPNRMDGGCSSCARHSSFLYTSYYASLHAILGMQPCLLLSVGKIVSLRDVTYWPSILGTQQPKPKPRQMPISLPHHFPLQSSVSLLHKLKR